MLEWTLHDPAAPVEDVGIDHGGRDVGVSKQLLDGADIVAPLQQVGREGVPERVAARRLRHSGAAKRLLESSLKDRIESRAPRLPGRSVKGGPG